MPVDYSKWHDVAGKSEPGESGEFIQHIKEDQYEEEEGWQAEDQIVLQAIGKEFENAGESWMHDVDQDSYEDFTVKRIWRVVKPRGAEYFKAGHLQLAEAQWLGGIELLQKVGLAWPSTAELTVQLRCNLAQLYLKQKRWDEARDVATAALKLDEVCEKALYRRALAHLNRAAWNDARRDLEKLLAKFPKNVEACRRLAEVKEALRDMAEHQRGATAKDLSNAIQDLTPEGTLRKVAVLVLGQDSPADDRWIWPWGRDEWLGTSRQKAVVTVHAVVRSVGGEELFNTRSRMWLPETPEDLSVMRQTMQQVAELDDIAGKRVRTPGDFYSREEQQPMRWRYGDPAVYTGFDLAVRSLRLGEKSIFEIDQPLLEPSVCKYYQKNGGVARVAGLPNFKHHIEERKLNLLAEELPEWELELETKTQRTVRAELELVRIDLYNDVSSKRTGGFLVHVADPGKPVGPPLRRGLKVMGNFVFAGALSGQALYRVERAVWVLGEEGEESLTEHIGLKAVWIPKCIGQVMRGANFCRMYSGARIEARFQEGPTPFEMSPKLASTLDWHRAMGHRPPVAVTVEVLEILA